MNFTKTSIPPYGQRHNWVPRRPEDFGDSGAFPEINVVQYPLEMGKTKTGANNKSSSSSAIAVQLDAQGDVKFSDLIARQGQSKNKIVYSKFTDLLPKQVTEEDGDLARPDPDAVKETTEKTKRALEALVQAKVAAAMPVKAAEKQAPAQYIRYTPATQGSDFNSGANQRIIRMVEVQRDPMSPPRFKINKKLPKGPPSPPAPVLHSPTRKVTVKEQQEWKIPPSISNWKNAKGYTIPLDKRLAADGRGLQSVHINENFSKFAEALYIADRKAREAIEMRAKVEQTIAQKEKSKKEEDLKQLANQIREQRSGIKPISDDKEAAEREEIRRERQKERRRDAAIQRAAPEKRTALQKEKERDISEKIALGLPNTGFNTGEIQFDSRLFNGTKGLDTGYGNEDDVYNVYDKPWRETESVANTIYRPSKNVDKDYGDDFEKALSTKRFVPDKGFEGADSKSGGASSARESGPVVFEQHHHDTNFDPFQIDDFLGNLKSGSSSANNNTSSNSGKRDHQESSSHQDSYKSDGKSKKRK